MTLVIVNFNTFARETVRTIATTLLAAITTTQEIGSGEDHQSVLDVIVLTLDE
jgi:hypothetical protein